MYFWTGPRKFPKLNVAGSTPVARSQRNPLSHREVSSLDVRSFKSTPNLRDWTSETVAGSSATGGSITPEASRQLCLQYARGQEIGGVGVVCERRQNGFEHLTRGDALLPPSPERRETHRRAQFPEPRALLAGNRDGALEARLGFLRIQHAGAFPSQPVPFGLVPELAALTCEGFGSIEELEGGSCRVGADARTRGETEKRGEECAESHSPVLVDVRHHVGEMPSAGFGDRRRPRRDDS